MVPKSAGICLAIATATLLTDQVNSGDVDGIGNEIKEGGERLALLATLRLTLLTALDLVT